MRSHLVLLTLSFAIFTATAQEESVLIHIRLIDGRTGNPMKNQQVGLENRNDGYREISVRTKTNSASRHSTSLETR